MFRNTPPTLEGIMEFSAGTNCSIEIIRTNPDASIIMLTPTMTDISATQKSWTFDDTGITEQGEYWYAITARMGATDGNTITRTVVYDTMAPLASGPFTPGSATMTVNASINLTVEGLVDTVSGLKEIRVVSPWCTGPTVPLTVSQESASFTITATQTGTWPTITLEIVDQAGNVLSQPFTLSQPVTVNP